MKKFKATYTPWGSSESEEVMVLEFTQDKFAADFVFIDSNNKVQKDTIACFSNCQVWG